MQKVYSGRKTMQRESLRNWATQEVAVHAAKVVLSALEDGGVQAVPVKGVVLARQIYDPSVRPISDVDLLIRPTDLRRALRIARSAGWSLIWDSKGVGNVNFVVQEVAFDVAAHFGPAGVSAVTMQAVFARAVRSQQPLGFDHWQIEKHDHALLLAIDAFKDKLGKGKPWAREDLERISNTDGFSARILTDLAATAQLGTMLAIVADWILSSAPSPVWSTVREHLGSLALRTGYMSHYERALHTETVSTWRKLYLSAMTRAVSDSAVRRALALGLGAIGTAAYVARHGSLSANAWTQRT